MVLKRLQRLVLSVMASQECGSEALEIDAETDHEEERERKSVASSSVYD